jgi:hypothetical protein
MQLISLMQRSPSLVRVAGFLALRGLGFLFPFSLAVAAP